MNAGSVVDAAVQVFNCFKYPKIVLLEDDMELAPDFFPYFAAGAGLLDSDPSLYTISAWNDHGQKRFVRDSTRLYRSDFFPGVQQRCRAARGCKGSVLHPWHANLTGCAHLLCTSVHSCCAHLLTCSCPEIGKLLLACGLQGLAG